MGHGIAQVAALAGFQVVLHEPELEALTQGMARIHESLEKGVALGKVSAGAREEALSRITGHTGLEVAVREAELVVEAIPEELKLKREVFRRVEEVAPQGVVLASNTSSLSIGEMAGVLRHPRQLLGLHFFNPVPVMKLVEVVWGPETAPEVTELGVAVARALGKEPIVVKDSPGFASSRLGVALGLEAMRMVEEGVASPDDIDRAMELGYRHPMGPLRLTDLVGLDVRLGIAEYLHDRLGGEHFRPPEILRRMVAEGRLGKKSGEGFYRWPEE